MNSAAKQQPAADTSKKPRVSPELTEFMHMLSALESQLTAPASPTNSSRREA